MAGGREDYDYLFYIIHTQALTRQTVASIIRIGKRTNGYTCTYIAQIERALRMLETWRSVESFTRCEGNGACVCVSFVWVLCAWGFIY